MKFTDDRPYITICTDCRDDANKFYKVFADGEWTTWKIVDLRKYRILVKFCPECWQKRCDKISGGQRGYVPLEDRKPIRIIDNGSL